MVSLVSLESKEHTELTIEELTASGACGTVAGSGIDLLVVNFFGIVAI